MASRRLWLCWRLGIGRSKPIASRMSASKSNSGQAAAAFSTKLQSHYKAHSSESYESAFFYEPGAYMDFLREQVQASLCWTPSEATNNLRLVDIGGGTGNFTKLLLEDHPTMRATVVDPFLESSSTSSTNQLDFVAAPAQVFATKSDDDWRKDMDQILCKEVVHHLGTSKDRRDIFQGMFRDLNPSAINRPSLLIVTRPQIDIDYPLWDAARAVWAQNQPSAAELEQDLIHSGFTKVQHRIVSYPCRISLSRWQQMIRNRFWSTFSHFTDEELNEACKGIELEYASRLTVEGILPFEDRLVFITASKVS